jgi:hypothetical protein
VQPSRNREVPRQCDACTTSTLQGGGSLRSLSSCGWALQRFESKGFETVLVPPAPHIYHACSRYNVHAAAAAVGDRHDGNADDEKAASATVKSWKGSMLYSKAAGTHPLSRTIETLEPRRTRLEH